MRRKRPEKKQPRKTIACFSAGSGRDDDPARPALMDIGRRINEHAEVVGLGFSGLSEPEYRGQVGWCIFNAHAFVFVLTERDRCMSEGIAHQIVRTLRFLVIHHEKNPKPVVWFYPPTVDESVLHGMAEAFETTNRPLGWVPDSYWPHFYFTASAEEVLDLVLGRKPRRSS